MSTSQTDPNPMARSAGAGEDDDVVDGVLLGLLAG
jgi:hypothetical protein